VENTAAGKNSTDSDTDARMQALQKKQSQVAIKRSMRTSHTNVVGSSAAAFRTRTDHDERTKTLLR